jgi:hypothetical protein
MEKWIELKGSGGRYKVSDKGRVYGSYRNKILSPSKDKDGYLRLALSVNKKRSYIRLHRLVAIAFWGDKGLCYDVDHIDCDIENNALDNLQWISKADHWAKRTRDGNKAIGERHGKSKYTEAQVRGFLVELKAKNISITECGVKHGLSRHSAYQIAKGKAWSWVDAS